MAINQRIIAEFDQEIKGTRKIFMSITDEILQYQPHEKSMNLKKLAIHVADIHNWFDVTINREELDFAKGGFKTPPCENATDIISFFENSASHAREVLLAASDEQLEGNWTMRNGEQIFFTLPKHVVVRTWCMNHLYHHRAQLGVYLRMNNIAVPGLYGPSADDQGM